MGGWGAGLALGGLGVKCAALAVQLAHRHMTGRKTDWFRTDRFRCIVSNVTVM